MSDTNDNNELKQPESTNTIKQQEKLTNDIKEIEDQIGKLKKKLQEKRNIIVEKETKIKELRVRDKYQNGVIYKIYCNDDTVKPYYIGSSINFKNRIKSHKDAVENPNNIEYDAYKYTYIRNHGGWSNWTMKIIKYVQCNSRKELEDKEFKFINEGCLNAIKKRLTPEDKIKRKEENNRIHKYWTDYRANKERNKRREDRLRRIKEDEVKQLKEHKQTIEDLNNILSLDEKDTIDTLRSEGHIHELRFNNNYDEITKKLTQLELTTLIKHKIITDEHKEQIHKIKESLKPFTNEPETDEEEDEEDKTNLITKKVVNLIKKNAKATNKDIPENHIIINTIQNNTESNVNETTQLNANYKGNKVVSRAELRKQMFD